MPRENGLHHCVPPQTVHPAGPHIDSNPLPSRFPENRKPHRPRKPCCRVWSLFFFCLLACFGISGSTAAAVLHIAKASNPNSASLKWKAAAGNNYTIQVAPSLDGPWAAQANTTPDSTAGDWTDPNLGAVSRRFYRLVEHGAFTNLLFNADVLPQAIIGAGVDASQTGAQAVLLASQLQGATQLITNGTLIQSGSQSWTYNPVPADRLSVQFSNGSTLDYHIGTMLGDFSGDANQFIQNLHDFRFRIVSAGNYDVYFTSIQTNGCNFVGSAQGTITSSNITYTAALVVSGQYCFTSDFGSSTLLDDHTVQGTIFTPGLILTVNQRHYFYIITDTRSSASTSEDWLGNTLTLGTDTYRWQDVHKHRSFTNGRPSHIDTSQSDLEWTATGTLQKNAASFGSYQYYYNPGDPFIRIQLAFPGTTIPLETYKRQ